MPTQIDIVNNNVLSNEHNEEKNQSPTARLFPFSVVIDKKHWPSHCGFTEESISSAKLLKPRSDDIFVCSYPKSGTTWIQHIVHQLLGKNEYEVCDDATLNGNGSLENGTNKYRQKAMIDISPMIEMVGSGHYDSVESPRVIKTHFTYADTPKGGGAKYIYSCRNPKDTLNSYFHHHRNFILFDFEHGDFDEFFELFMDGHVGYDDYFDHLISWLDGIEKEDEQILCLKYEDMIMDLESSVVQIATFIGGNAAELIKDQQQLKKIVEASSLASMKVNQQRWFPFDSQRGNFIRKGGSRDWTNSFSYEQSERMDMRFRQRLSGTATAEWWATEMDWHDGDENDTCATLASLDITNQ